MDDFKNRYQQQQQQQQCPALRTPQQGPPVREGKRRQVRIHKVRMFASGPHSYLTAGNLKIQRQIGNALTYNRKALGINVTLVGLDVTLEVGLCAFNLWN